MLRLVPMHGQLAVPCHLARWHGTTQRTAVVRLALFTGELSQWAMASRRAGATSTHEPEPRRRPSKFTARELTRVITHSHTARSINYQLASSCLLDRAARRSWSRAFFLALPLLAFSEVQRCSKRTNHNKVTHA